MSTPRLDNVEDVYPLSPMQEGMLFHTISAPGSGVFVDQITLELAGPLDLAAFKSAWDQIGARHATLRTAFLWDGLDEPLQVVREHVAIAWTEEDWSAHDEDDQARRLDVWLRDDRARGFELDAAPLMRLALIRGGANAWRLVWSFHHLIADGWSAQVLLDELFTIYDAVRSGDAPRLDPPLRYRDFIAWHGRQDDASAERFWRERLDGFEASISLDMPQGRPPTSSGREHRTLSVALDETATAALRVMAGKQRVTLNTAVVGAWALLLGRRSRARDVVFGVTVAGRPTDLAGVDRAVGLFINTLPLRLDIAPAMTLGDWLRGVQQEQLELHHVEHSPLAAVQRWSDVPAGQPLFESIFVFENYPPSTRRAAADGLEVRGMNFVEQSNYPLAVLVLPGDRLEVTLVYDTERFDDAWAERLADETARLLEQFTDGVERPLSEFVLPSYDDLDRVRVWGAGPELTADTEVDSCMHELIAAVAAAQPDASAVVFEETSITYADLLRAAEDVATRLRRAGVTPDQPVGLYMPRSIDMIIGILGIMIAGGAYVPLDPTYPREHLRRLLDGARLDVVLTQHDCRDDLPGAATLIAIDDADDPHPTSPDAELIPASPDNLAYVIHTSGSTGEPKGVMVTHRNLVYSTRARMQHYGKPVGRFLLLSSFAFDSSVAGIFWTLASGGTLVLPAPRLEQDIERLLAVVADQHVTHVLCLPTLFELMLDHAAQDQLNTLAVAVVAGEACPTSVLETHRRRLPAAALHNEYGPTEATVWCTAHRVHADDRGGAIPIGRPIPGAHVHLLDHHGQPAPIGAAGELYVGGPGVARGYLHDADRTDERFVTIDVDGRPERVYRTGDLACYRDDGALLFLGRADSQLKVRGHRIEVGAVETILRAHASIADVAVAGHRVSGRSGARLVAYVEPVGSVAVDAEMLRNDLGAAMPDYMVPDTIVSLPSLPRRPNGKIDRRALPDPADHGPTGSNGFVAPRNETERTLAEIWQTLLGHDRVGVDDNYFALGGDSIISIQMISRARQAGVHLEPGQVAAHPTIARLAAAAGVTATSSTTNEPIVGAVPLAPIQRWFFEAHMPAPHHWNQSNLFAFDAGLDADDLDAALRSCLQHHDMLRARFVQNGDGVWQQAVAAFDDERVLEIVDADPSSPGANAAIAAAQKGLDLASGPILRAVLIRAGVDAPGRLLIATHHLVIDVVSWTILMDDLETAYRQRRTGQAIALPPRTTSYRGWVTHLAERGAHADDAIWDASPPDTPVPTDRTEVTAGTEASGDVVRVSLDTEATSRLNGRVHDAYRTRVDDLLITALTQTLARWTGSDTLQLGLEGHGRADDVDGVDLSRTIGWCTAYYPLTLCVGGADPPELAIKSVKEQLRAVPGGGVDYGVRRYLDGALALADSPAPPVLFNYLGRARGSDDAAAFEWLSSEEGTSRDPRNPRAHVLEVVGAIRNDRLAIDWHYSATLHDRVTIERLADDFVETLSRLIEHCLTEATGGATPSDMPQAGLDQGELDDLLSTLASPPSSVETILPLLPLQKALLLYRGRDAAVDPGFLHVRCTLNGPLDQDRWQRAWQTVIEWHPALRMSIAPRRNGDPLAVVWRRATVPWTSLDWRDRSEQEQRRDLASLLETDRAQGLDLEHAPAHRITVVRTADTNHTVVWTCHHLFVDGWSSAIALNDVMRLYDALGAAEPLPAPPPSNAFRAYSAWAHERDDTAAESYWRERLAGFGGAPPLSLGQAPQGAGGQDQLTHAFDPARSDAIRAAATELHLTPNALIQGAWALVLSRLLETDDVVFGATVAGRSTGIDGLERMVGYYSNVVPVRVRIDRELHIRDWLQALRDEQFQTQPFEHAVLADVHAWSEVPGHRTLFDSFVVVENFPAHAHADHDGLSLADFHSDLTAAFPVTIAVVPGPRWRVQCRYDRSRCTPHALARVFAEFESALCSLAANPDATVGAMADRVDVEGLRSPTLRDETADETAPLAAPRDETELQLVKIWEQMLGVNAIGIHDDYFALGGTSIAAVRMFARIEAAFGTTLPLSTLLEGATIAHLAEALRGASASESGFKCVVPIQASGSQPPIACVHAGGAHVLFYRFLAQHLGPDQPVFGLEPVGLDGLEQPLTTIGAMAERYVDELLAVQPRGPYRLVGYCIGGSVCLEMARVLEAHGHAVDLLTVIDSGLPSRSARVVTPAQQVRDMLRRRGPIGVLGGIVRRAGYRTRQRWDLAAGGADGRRRVYQERVEEACRVAFGLYHAAPCVTPITLVRSSEFARDESRVFHLDWADYTSRLDIHVVDAGHTTILLDPHVEQVAAVIRERLTSSNGS